MKTETYKSRYAVPAVFTLATHALLFLGFDKPPPAVDRHDPAPPIRDGVTEIVCCEVKPVTPPEVDSETTVETSGGAAIPAGFEPPTGVIDPTSILVPVTHEPVARDFVKYTRIPIAPAGLAAGEGFGRPGSMIVSGGDLDEVPRVKFRLAPAYPYSLKMAGISGEVWVEFTVAEDGSVLNARVVRSTHGEFEAATLRAVTRWKFESGKRGGRPVRFRMTLPVVFSLRNEEI